MPLINEKLKFKKATENFPSNQSTNFSQNAQANEASQSKGFLTLPPALLQIIPWIPFALEAMTGQKIPSMGGTIGEIQNSLTQIQFSLTQVLTNQQQLYTKLASLETNLSQQVKDFRLIAQETKRSLEFTRPAETET